MEDAIGKFLTLAGISAEPPKKAEETPASGGGTQTVAPAPPAAPRAPAPQPNPCASTLQSVAQRAADLKTHADSLKNTIDAQVTKYKDFTDEVNGIIGDANASGAALCSNVKDELPKIEQFNIDDAALSAALKNLQTETEQLDDKIKETSCKGKEKDTAKTALKNAQNIAEWSADRIADLRKANKDVQALAAKIKRTLNDPEAFWESRSLGPHLESTEADISVTRKDNMNPDAATQEFRPKFTVVFGSTKRFFIAGGIAASAAHRRTFNTIDGFIRDHNGDFVKDANGAPTRGKVIGLQEDSVGRVAPSVLLHGVLLRPDKGIVSGVALSLGVGAAGGDDSVLQYLLGPTISFAEDHLFVTVGAFRGTEKELGGDFYVGAEAKDVTVPVVDRHTWTFGFAVTYRIQ